jgi:hypothetical protein
MRVDVSYEWHPGHDAMVRESGRMVRALELEWLNKLRSESRLMIARVKRAKPPGTVAEMEREIEELRTLPDRVGSAFWASEV